MTKKQKDNSLFAIGTFLFLIVTGVGAFYTINVFSQSREPISNVASGNIETDRYVESDWYQPVSLQVLENESKYIFVGRVLRNKSRRTNMPSKVDTLYRVEIEEVVKGRLTVGREITISLPGGMVGKNKNKFFHVFTPGFRKMQNDSSYLMFVEKERSLYTTTRGPQGIFEVADNSSVVSFGGGVVLNDNSTVQDFDKVELFREIRNSVKGK